MAERTLIILKPDAVNRTLVGEIIHRFERKGLKIVGIKMAHLTEEQLREHYAHLTDKPFYPRIERFMRTCPTILMVLEGKNCIEIVRKLAGPTHGGDAPAGTIRGDYSMGMQNVIHASDSIETAEVEIKRFFKEDELFDYERIDLNMIYEEESI